MFDRAWLVVVSILLAPVIPALALILCPTLVGVAAVATVLLLAAMSALAFAG